MKNSKFFVMFVVIPMFSLLTANSFPAKANAVINLLCDPGFDISTDPGFFPNSGCWHPDWIGTAGSVLRGGHYRSSPYSLHVYTGSEGSHYLSRPYHTDIASGQGEQYHAGAYFSTPPGFTWQSGSSAFIRVSFKNSSHAEISHIDSPYYQSANASWQLYEITTPAAPAGTAYVGFTIYLQKPDGLNGQSVVDVDDCFLEETVSSPSLDIHPMFLNFGAANTSMIVKIFNTGGGTLHWSLATSGQNWLQVNPSSGSVASGQSNNVTVQVERTGLSVGAEHMATITVTPDVGDLQNIPVYLTVAGNVPQQPSIVSVNGTQLIIWKRLSNGNLDSPCSYTIKGFTWSPASIQTTGSHSARRQAFIDWNAYDLGMMKGASANTVYTFLDFGLNVSNYTTVLDNLYKNGIMAIITVDENGTNNVSNIDNVVNAYKNHPAVLMWAIGNEWNINKYHGKFSTVQEAAEATEQAAQLIQSLDTNHPVASIYGEVNIPDQTPSTYVIVNNICPSVDVWGLNIYRGREFYDLFTDWAAHTNKPMFLSEFGIDSFHTTQYYPSPIDGYIDEQEQTDWDEDLWMDLMNELSAKNPANVCLGGTYFEWNDEWWKVAPSGQQDKDGFYTVWNPGAFPDSFANEEYFGIVKIDENIRMPKASYYKVQELFDEVIGCFPPNSYLLWTR